MRRIVYSTLLFLLLSLSAVAQNGGINFQGMARNAAGEALANQKISLRLSVLLNSESGTVEYSETKEVTTSGQGIFSVVVGDGNILTKTGNFSDINWKNSLKFLKVELDPSGGTNFALMGSSRLQAVPFAYYANGVDAKNIQGTLPITKGGTGVGSITALKTSLGIDQVSNTSDANKPLSTAAQAALETKVDKVSGKGLSANDYSSAEKSKLAAITGTNTGDQDLSGLATTAALAGKVDKVNGKELSSNDFTTAEKTKLAAITGTNTGDQDLSALATNTALALKANTADMTTSLALKANTADVTASLALKANTADMTTALATKANASDVTSGLAGKENVSNKSTAVDLGGTSPSDVFYPSQKAVKAYIAANAAAGGIADGGITTIKLADDAVTDAKVANGINKTKVGLGNVENTALTTWSGSTNLTTVGTITSGTWDGTPIDYSKLNLAQSIVSDDIADGTISMRKLGIAKADLVSLGLAADDELVMYRAGQGLSETTAIIGVRSSGAPRVETTIDLNPISTNFIQDGAVTNDKIALGISKSKVGLDNVDNTTDALKPISTATQTALGLKAPLESPTFTGTVSGITKSMVGLGLVDNTADLSKPISTAAQTALDLKAPLESPTFTGTVSGITKSMVGLGLVDNTADLSKPISTATQTALNLKANASDVTADLATKVDRVNGKELSSNDYTTAEKTKLAAITGTNTGDQTTITGNAGTASKLATPKNINGIPFDGSNDINVPAAAGTLTGTTLNSTVTGSSLTSIGTLANLTVTNPIVGSITGNSATATSATTAGNITATSNTTLTTLSSLTSVGTLTSATVNGKVIVGASTSASTSAVLEVNSTTQGFLPPRVYAAQRDAIVSPVAGLTIWCINCGQYGELNVYNGVAWKNMLGSSTSSVPSISIGQNYYGGTIAYILQSGDPGYDPNTPHGLVAATVNQSTGIQWSNGSFTTTGATGTAIGTGLANTNAIIASQGETATSYAAGLARAYKGGGYTDWYLPSKDELAKLYAMKLLGFGGFTNNYYWSSTEYGNDYAWLQYFFNGTQYDVYKDVTWPVYVRAIRAF